MLDEETHRKLCAMKMHGLATAFQECLEQRGRDKLSFEERFGMMVDREWTERQERRVTRRLQIAKLRDSTACVEDINYRHPRGLNRSVMLRLSACKWIESHENVIVTGATGVGKTWISCALDHSDSTEVCSAQRAWERMVYVPMVR